MKVNEAMFPRQSFSADKSKDVNESDSSSEVSNDLLNKTYKCESASFLSVRNKHACKNRLDTLLTENISPKYLKLDRKEDHKLFLKAYQTLERLNKIIALNTTKPQFQEKDSDPEIASNPKKANLREIILYQNILKRLLEERCTLTLKEECDICIKRSTKIIDDFKYMYMNEKQKMMTLPIQACNRFVSSNDINIQSLQLLIKKLQVLCDLQFSIRSSYQKIIDCFHLGLDFNLYLQVTRTNVILGKLKSSLFYWAYKCVSIFIQKLCLVDPNTVSTEFLQSILECCQIFNLLVKSHGTSKHYVISLNSLFQVYIRIGDSKELPFNLVLNYLAFFEAKATAEKIVHSLTSSCKKCSQINVKSKRLLSVEKKSQSFDSNTSDYYSGTVSLPDVENAAVKTLPFLNSNFINVLFSLTQRNQGLMLRYLYAITSVQNLSNETKALRRASLDFNRKPQSARQLWSLSEQDHKNDSCIALEEIYWKTFWNNTKNFVLKILFEIPYHQYGDSGAGSIILWPDSFLQTLLQCLMQSIESSDITVEGRHAMKQIYDHILVHNLKVTWDKSFLSAHFATYSHLCAPVPTSSNRIGTHPGNLLYTCLEPAVCIFDKEFHHGDLFFLSLYQLQAVLGCYILWIGNKTRALISSQNLSNYLLISRSDCSLASNFLKEKALPHLSLKQFPRKLPSTKEQIIKVILNQIDTICEFEKEAPNVIYNVCFSALTSVIVPSLKQQNSLKKFTFFKTSSAALDAQENLIFPLSEVIENLSDYSSVMKSIINALTHAIENSLQQMSKSTRCKNLPVFISELSKFLQWMDCLQLPETEKMDFKQMHSIRKLNAILKLIHSSTNQPAACFKRRNRIIPLVALDRSPDDNILNAQEKKQWQKLSTKSIFLPCI